LVIQDLFKAANTKYRSLNLRFGVSFYEIYGGRCYDLLNNKNQLAILEDKNQEVSYCPAFNDFLGPNSRLGGKNSFHS
jgi:Kinesin motor domain.